MVARVTNKNRMSKQELQQVEEHTGKSAEDLTEEEMEKALDDLGIQDQELTAEDEAAIDAEAA